IKRIHRETGATIIFVTHDQEEALALSDSICLMNEGAVEQIGSPTDVYEYPVTEFAAGFIGISNLFRGKLTAEGKLDTPHGVLPLPDATTCMNGQDVALSIRPEHVRIVNRGNGFVTGTVVENIYAGSDTK